MITTSAAGPGYGRIAVSVLGPTALWVLVISCARLPVPTQTIHQDERAVIGTERVAEEPAYTHPVSFTNDDVARILKRVSVKERPASWPLRLFGRATEPERLFCEDEIQAVAPYLADALRAAKPNERVTFALSTPGLNPTYEHFVTSGWIAVRTPYLHIALDYVRNLQPRSPTRNYSPFYPEMPPAPPAYDVFFEPPQFWGTDPVDGTQAIQFRDFLRTVEPQSEGG